MNKNHIIYSDVSDRDGIGCEFYEDDVLILDIFRDDTEKRRYISLFKSSIELKSMEEYIAVFKARIPWDFIDYTKLWGEP